MQLLIDRIPTPIGDLTIVADERGSLRAVEWADYEGKMRRRLRLRYGQDLELKPRHDPGGVSAAIKSYFAGDLHAINCLPVETAGTEFQETVWQAIRQIPCGTTTSYTALAERIERSSAVRAVARANGANPISVVVPCHRVIANNGDLTGYGGGIARKRWLLHHEGAK